VNTNGIIKYDLSRPDPFLNSRPPTNILETRQPSNPNCETETDAVRNGTMDIALAALHVHVCYDESIDRPKVKIIAGRIVLIISIVSALGLWVYHSQRMMTITLILLVVLMMMSTASSCAMNNFRIRILVVLRPADVVDGNEFRALQDKFHDLQRSITRMRGRIRLVLVLNQ